MHNAEKHAFCAKAQKHVRLVRRYEMKFFEQLRYPNPFGLAAYPCARCARIYCVYEYSIFYMLSMFYFANVKIKIPVNLITGISPTVHQIAALLPM